MSRVTQCDICGDLVDSVMNLCEISIPNSLYLQATEPPEKRRKKSERPIDMPAYHRYDICPECFEKHLKNVLFGVSGND